MDNRKNNLPIEHRFMIIPFVEFHNSLFSNYPVVIVPLSHLSPMAGNLLQKSKIRCNDSDISVSKYDGSEPSDRYDKHGNDKPGRKNYDNQADRRSYFQKYFAARS